VSSGGDLLGGALPLPFEGFDLQVLTDRPVYAEGEPVRITVSATNHAARAVEHRFAGWQRFDVTIRDDTHHVVAEHLIAEHVARGSAGDALDRWLPGQMALWPLYWAQHSGPLVPAHAGLPAGPRVPPGRYRVRVAWLGREAELPARGPEATSGWFELV
jgi:hypothetical protein